MSLPDVTSALVTIAQSTFTAQSIDCAVFDGEPAQDPAIGDVVLVIGSGLETDAMADYDIGTRSQWDTYDILGYVRATSGDTVTVDDRNAVWAAWLAFRRGIQQDPQLGTVLISGGNIRPSGADYNQTQESDLDADAEGTYAQVDFRLTVTELVRTS